MKANKRLFPASHLGRVDYLIGGALLLFCFFAFFQGDIYTSGWHALNYLFGNPLDFYENCKKIQGHGVLAANYPPALYIIFALWLYPFKLLGLIKSPLYFSPYLVYWLKALTSLAYIATGFLFYRVTQIYTENKAWGTYATWLWLTTPLAVFSQFIYSQYDIFYVFLTLAGFLFFLRKNIFFAAFLFGLAITFKYFPFFVFISLLLFFEKKIWRLFLCLLIFSIPMLLILRLYGHSPAYIEGVIGFSAVQRVFSTFLDISGTKIYYIFALLSLLAGFSYFLEFSKDYKKIAAYIFLCSSILPFLFITWHPQWLIFITPAMLLTTVMHKHEKINRLLHIDLFGMFFFVVYVTVSFPNNVDLAMFQASLLHIPLELSHNMGSLFRLFKGNSANVYLSVIWGYLVLQIALKYKALFVANIDESKPYLYHQVRINYYLGLFIFLIPAICIFYVNYRDMGLYVLNPAQEKTFGELTAGRTFEESFVAKKPILKQVDLFLATYCRKNLQDIQLEVLSTDHKQLAAIKRSAIGLLDNSWESFQFPDVKLQTGKTYILRLSSAKSVTGNAITWWASSKPSYANGFAIVDGKQQYSNFAFRLKFKKT